MQDRSSTGRSRPWHRRKKESQDLAASYRRLGEDKAFYVEQCATWLKFNACPNGHERKLVKANFCRARLCPMCSWRRSLVVYYQLQTIYHEAVKTVPLRFLFLTLTVRSVDSKQLSKQIDHLFQSWHRFSRRKAFSSVVRGWFRAMEITYNYEKQSYHPHFHVLLAVKPSFFSKGKYITQAKWVSLWKEALRAEYNPIVDVRIVKSRKPGDPMDRAVAEIGKYAVKADHYLIPGNSHATDQAVNTLDAALKHRRLIAFGGLFKKIHRKLRLQETEEADLIRFKEPKECSCSVCQSILLEEIYRWNIGFKGYIRDNDTT